MRRLLILLSAGATGVVGQTDPSNDSVGVEIREGVQAHWRCEVLDDTLRATVIVYYPSHISCGMITDYAVAICLDERGDSLRVFDWCPDPEKKYDGGQKVLVSPWRRYDGHRHPCDRPLVVSEMVAGYKVVRTTFGWLE